MCIRLKFVVHGNVGLAYRSYMSRSDKMAVEVFTITIDSMIGSISVLVTRLVEVYSVYHNYAGATKQL